MIRHQFVWDTAILALNEKICRDGSRVVKNCCPIWLCNHPLISSNEDDGGEKQENERKKNIHLELKNVWGGARSQDKMCRVEWGRELVWGHNSEGWMCSSSKRKIYLFALLLAAVYESSSHFHLPYLGFFFSLIKSRSMSCEGFFFTFFPLSLWLSFYIWHTASNAHANKDVRDERFTCPSKELSSLARMPLTERDPKAEKRRKKKVAESHLIISSSVLGEIRVLRW